jgi:hypothetical protein
MPQFQPSDIGPLYDFGIATRDGSSLACKNKDGALINVSQLAYMTSINKQNSMKEATELQEKQTLVQLSSANLIDREFDQWPQQTQGDWSGGSNQRVFGTNGTTNQFWDGEGILWPVTDWVPQKAFIGPVVAAPGTGLTNFAFDFRGTVGGAVEGIGNGYGYHYVTGTNPTFQNRVVFRSADTTVDVTIGAAGLGSVIGMAIVNGALWALFYDNANTITLYQFANAALTSISNTNIVTNVVAGAGNFLRAVVTGAIIGNKTYMAVALTYQITATTVWTNLITILDYSGGGAPAVSTLQLPISPNTYTNPPLIIDDLNFSGANLYVTMSDGYQASLITSAPPYTAASNIEVTPGLAHMRVCSVGPTLLLIGWSGSGYTPQTSRMDLFTLTGSTLQEIGDIYPQGAGSLAWVGSCAGFSDYALWAAIYKVQGATTFTLSIYAYDLVRGRLFRALTINDPGFVSVGGVGAGSVAVSEIGLFGSQWASGNPRTLGGVTFRAQMGLAIYTGDLSNGVEVAREFYWGVTPVFPTPTFNTLLQGGTEITSGLIDFTAASNKLFRQGVVSFQGGVLPNSAANGVSFSAWLDQDPGRLNSNPDFTGSTAASATVPTQLSVPIGSIARKLVYRVISFGQPTQTVSLMPTYAVIGSGAMVVISGGSTTTVATLTTAAAFGDTVVVIGQSGGHDIDNTCSIVDSRSNAWTTDRAVTTGVNGGLMVGHSVLTTAMQVGDTITVTWKNASAAQSQQAAFVSVLRIKQLPNPVVDASTGVIGSGTTANSGSINTTLLNDAMIGVTATFVQARTYTAGAGWTNVDGFSSFGIGSMQPMTQTAGAPGPYAATATLNSSATWASIIVAFKGNSTNTWQNLPKLISVAIQVATGWVWDIMALIAPNVTMNSGGTQAYAYQNQSVPGQLSIDHVVAYNFIKQIWRQKGGQCTLYLPNGDSYPALLQSATFESPKPFAASFRADQQSSFQPVLTLKLREDI